ncbi:unnamed protein product [marine sediment metagenome]|uniref:Uncharacterized protein n=1 Tax=marine sediment metagenome TaxID=412755 RepID=X1T297_9ZZZZ
MADVGDIFKLDLRGNIGGKLAVNTFFYRANTGDLDAADVVLEFDISVLPEIAAVEGVRKGYDAIECINLFDDEDDSTQGPTTEDGLIEGEDGGGHSAIPFNLASLKRSIRDGAKRFGPLSETYNADGIITGGGMITALANLADALEADLDLGAGHSVSPVIVKRIPYELEDPVRTAYRLPENVGESDYSLFSSALPVLRATTQNSRKPWVGA